MEVKDKGTWWLCRSCPRVHRLLNEHSSAWGLDTRRRTRTPRGLSASSVNAIHTFTQLANCSLRLKKQEGQKSGIWSLGGVVHKD